MRILFLLVSIIVLSHSCSKDDINTNKKPQLSENWTEINGITTSPLSSIWGTSDSIYSVGGSNSVGSSEHLGIIIKNIGNTWQIEKNDWNIRLCLQGITGKSSNEIYVVGTTWDGIAPTGVFLKYNGNEWIEQHYPYLINKIKIVNGNVYVTATNALFRLDGDSLTKIFDLNFHCYDVWGTSDNNLYVVGFSGEDDFILHYDGFEWTNMLQNTNISSCFLQGIEGISTNEIYAIGTGGKFLKYDGSEWKVIKDGFDPIYDIHIFDSNRIYFVTGKYGSNGMIYRYDASSTFELEYVSQAEWLYGIWGNPNLGMYVVGSDGKIISKLIK